MSLFAPSVQIFLMTFAFDSAYCMSIEWDYKKCILGGSIQGCFCVILTMTHYIRSILIYLINISENSDWLSRINKNFISWWSQSFRHSYTFPLNWHLQIKTLSLIKMKILRNIFRIVAFCFYNLPHCTYFSLSVEISMEQHHED